MEVLADIGRYSEIELADPALRNLPVGGAFNVDQTEAIFAALQNNFGVHAEWIDARHVRLTSAGDKDLFRQVTFLSTRAGCCAAEATNSPDIFRAVGAACCRMATTTILSNFVARPTRWIGAIVGAHPS